MATITLGEQSFALPKNTIPYLVELASQIDNEGAGLAGAIARNGRIVETALKFIEADPSVAAQVAAQVELDFEALSRAAGEIMRAAGFKWGEAPPATAPAPAGNNQASPDSSGTSLPPSPPDAATAGPETSPS